MQVNYSPGEGHSHHPQNEARQTRQLPFNPAFHTIKSGRADTIEQSSQEKNARRSGGKNHARQELDCGGCQCVPFVFQVTIPNRFCKQAFEIYPRRRCQGPFIGMSEMASKPGYFPYRKQPCPIIGKPTGNLPAVRNRFQNGSFRVIGKCCFAHGGGIFAKQKHRGPNTFSVWPPVLLLVELSGLEPPTYALRTRRSPD